MSAEDTARLNELVRTITRREAEIVLSNAQNIFTAEMASKLIENVGTISTDLAVMRSQVDNLEHTLLGNGQPGTCKQHGDSIAALRDFMNSIKGRMTAMAWACATALVITGLALAFMRKDSADMHKDSADSQAFHVAVQAGQLQSSARQTVIQESLDAADLTAKQAKAQRDAIQATQAEGATVIYREYRKMRP